MRRALVAVAGLALLAATASTASATPPGLNGALAFERASGAGQIATMTATGGAQTQLTSTPEQNSDAAWSPDGTKIAFTSHRDGGDAEIYIMNADGSNQVRFTVQSGVDEEPTWSPDGARIAWASDRFGNLDIVSANVNGSDVRQHTSNGAFVDTEPEWSPDGSRIAFRSNRSGSGDIYLLSPTGAETGIRQLTSDGNSDTSPTWSPDGTRVAFASLRSGAGDIWSVSVAGSGAETDPRRLTSDPGVDQQPAWSPDGARIAFASGRLGGTFHIWTVGSGGTEASPLQLTSTVIADVEPAWQSVAPAPVAASLSPPSAFAGAGDLAVIVDGSNFVRRSQVRWNGQPRSTQFVGANRLIFVAPAADLAAPGTAQVTVVTSPVGGGTSGALNFTVSPPSASPLAINRARLEPRWSASRLRGRLVLGVTVGRPALLEARVLRRSGKGKPFVTRRFRLTQAGSFTRRLALIPTLLPDRYLVRVREVGGGAVPLPTAQRLTKLNAPPEGVASRAVVTTALGGRARPRIPRGPGIIIADFRMAALPKKGRPITITWFFSGVRGPIDTIPQQRTRRIDAFLFPRSRGPLQAGSYRAELRAGRTLVAVARTRII